MDFTSLESTLAILLGTRTTDANYTAVLPQIIIDAEARCYAECDFISTRVSTTLPLVSGTRSYALPTVTYNAVPSTALLIVQSINVITPAATAPDAGTRVPLTRTSRDFLDFVWPTAAGTLGVPSYFSMLDDQTVRFAPTPDAAYNVEIYAVLRPPTMSVTVPNTYLGDKYPALFFAACMVFGAGYQKNFGSQADDPKMAQSWEQQYQLRKAAAMPEAFRQKGEGEAWTPYQPSPIAQPART